MGPYPKQRKTSQKKKSIHLIGHSGEIVFSKNFVSKLDEKNIMNFHLVKFGRILIKKKKKSVSQILFLTIQNDCV